MSIVAFLQNPWFRPGTSQHHIELYRDNQEFHRKVLAMSMSGRRLVRAFGDLYDKIHWSNTSWRAAERASGRMPTDIAYMSEVISAQNPELILCFGRQAHDACMEMRMMSSRWKIPYLSCHHPNAYGKFQSDLNMFADAVREYLHIPSKSCSPIRRP